MKKNLQVQTEMFVRLRQINAATGLVEHETPRQKNLVLDGGLNALAQSTNASTPCSLFTACRVGSGSTSNSIPSGAVTFTQVGTTITASVGFFTAGMNGWLFKYGTGTGGAESYITFVNSTTATSSVSATVAVPTVATVWNVIRTAMETLLYTNSSYETSGTSCQSTIAANVVTHKRTFNFAIQVAPYNVNEVGYFSAAAGTTIFGRIVLSSTEVVNPTNFLQVVLELVVTYAPGTVTAVVDVGTNINTAGNAIVENLLITGSRNLAIIASNGTTSNANDTCSLDASANGTIRGLIATYTQNAATAQTGVLNPTNITFQSSLAWTYNSVRGQMRLRSTATISTSGQTLYGVALQGNSYIGFDVKFTSTYALPTGSFLPQVTFLVTYDRNLSN